jgi:glyoxylate utilization-related uncharacterized protein
VPDLNVRAVAIWPGVERAYDEDEWRDAIVFVRRGEIELECLSGERRSFQRGHILWLANLPLRALHNRGDRPALLLVVCRAFRSTDEFRRPPRSYLT